MTMPIKSKPEVGKPVLMEGGPAPGLSAGDIARALSGLSDSDVHISFDGLLLVPFHIGVEPGGTVAIHVRSKHPTGGRG